jgi:hypothetical protein
MTVHPVPHCSWYHLSGKVTSPKDVRCSLARIADMVGDCPPVNMGSPRTSLYSHRWKLGNISRTGTAPACSLGCDMNVWFLQSI